MPSESPEEKSGQSISTDDASQPHRYDGLATAAAIVFWGALCLPASSYFDAHGSLHTAWTVAGIALGTIGVGGAFIEAANLSLKDALADFGLAIVLLALAGGAQVLSTASWLGTPFVGAIKALVAFCVALTVFGLARGIARASEASHDRREAITSGIAEQGPTRSLKVQALIVGLLGTATAVANLLVALLPKK